MRRSSGIPVELAAQELAAAPAAGMIEVDDICDVDPLLRTGAFAANASHASTGECAGGPGADGAGIDDSVEIELSAEQIDALLSNPQAV